MYDIKHAGEVVFPVSKFDLNLNLDLNPVSNVNSMTEESVEAVYKGYALFQKLVRNVRDEE